MIFLIKIGIVILSQTHMLKHGNLQTRKYYLSSSGVQLTIWFNKNRQLSAKLINKKYAIYYGLFEYSCLLYVCGSLKQIAISEIGMGQMQDIIGSVFFFFCFFFCFFFH